jgi:hypothetical protein
MSKLAKALTAAAGNAGGAGLMVEDVFSTYLYDGTDSSLSITNGIDLAEEGGMVWCKMRNNTLAYNHNIFDTERGIGKLLESNTTDAEETALAGYSLTSFNSDGFTLGLNWNNENRGATTNASWTFRKAEKFFDVVTWTGDGTAGRQIAHNLGSAPAVIITKNTNASNRQWFTYHQSLGNTQAVMLDQTNAAFTYPAWNNTTPTDSVFFVNSSGLTNQPGKEYVAYLFASDAGGFGDDGSENIIKCGSFTADGSGNATVDLGFEPQWLLTKYASGSSSWSLSDSMRGFPVGSGRAYLAANTTAAEGVDNGQYIYPTSSGFASANGAWVGGATIIYIAIRRPMKTPESGTEVFDVDFGTSSGALTFNTGFPVDANILRSRGSSGGYFSSRLTGNGVLRTDDTGAESTDTRYWDSNVELVTGDTGNFSNWMGYSFKRATGFFDVVAYTGDGTSGRQIPHNLGAVPQLMITKARNSVELWRIGYTADQIFTNWGSTGYAWGSNGNIYGDGTQWVDPTSSYVTAGLAINNSSKDYIQYLFGTLAGVSKVGSYTGNGTTQNIECGFSGGARFLMLWNRTNPTLTYVWDSERGIITGSPDPRLAINSTAAEVTTNDALNTYAGGFGVTSSTVANRNGDTYIFMAIA